MTLNPEQREQAMEHLATLYAQGNPDDNQQFVAAIFGVGELLGLSTAQVGLRLYNAVAEAQSGKERQER